MVKGFVRESVAKGTLLKNVNGGVITMFKGQDKSGTLSGVGTFSWPEQCRCFSQLNKRCPQKVQLIREPQILGKRELRAVKILGSLRNIIVRTDLKHLYQNLISIQTRVNVSQVDCH